MILRVRSTPADSPECLVFQISVLTDPISSETETSLVYPAGMNSTEFPTIIQGGMGAGVSCWSLANVVSKAGQLGVVAGTALDLILARRLQVGDPGGHMRRALANFPIPDMAQRVLDRYFVPDGKEADKAFKSVPLFKLESSVERDELLITSNFTEVFLAKEGHDGVVGINYLEKIQVPTLPSIFGAMLGGVSFILMGAGIPRAIPKVLDDLAEAKAVELPINVVGAEPGEEHLLKFDPNSFYEGGAPTLPRPKFLAIVSSVTVATVMARKATGKVDGLIIEGPRAGGHNAPPRGQLQLDDDGEPIFGERDICDIKGILKLKLPFWLAGTYGSPERVREALELGATGVQVGTGFAFCKESGYAPEHKSKALARIVANNENVRTDPLASPTGFPFKIFEIEGTMSQLEVYQERKKICDLGFLRHAYKKDDGKLGWRCPSEPDKAFLQKGGKAEEMVGRKCVCNGLMANLGLAQRTKAGGLELPLLTSGADTSVVHTMIKRIGTVYSAKDVVEYLLDSDTNQNSENGNAAEISGTV